LSLEEHERRWDAIRLWQNREQAETRRNLRHLLGSCPRLKRLDLTEWRPEKTLIPEGPDEPSVFSHLPTTLQTLLLAGDGWNRFDPDERICATGVSGADLALIGARCGHSLEELSFGVSERDIDC
jgi:hypothetical protein